MPQDIDITKLTVEELDDLLVRTAKHRASLQPGPSTDHPKPTDVVVNPGWYTGLVDFAPLLQIWRSGFGWLSFLIPVNERAHLLSLFFRHTHFLPEQGVANPPQPRAGVGTVH